MSPLLADLAYMTIGAFVIFVVITFIVFTARLIWNSTRGRR